MKFRVIFASTVFENVATGPGMYARYLWDAFRDDPEIEFHLVAPTIREKHPRLHAAGTSSRSSEVYAAVADAALRLASGSEARTIIHGNGAHAMARIIGYPGRGWSR